eukprot:CAMPEP_0201134236 /NCGR_PEP_ID=MMETSP0850-20130426/51020_1 /ASSEMBLY_ACC=CAM_ASM_000622 /TAXON_ID=183588 /ORGANISM="Pseudo-nitzschia fraudulenta, Strain WWA7" /LENGTH=93 /DNA_ID=CAMNT_0047405075 /DNA_START=132 /DNA_END=410 /DNA_ORIENTATION=-
MVRESRFVLVAIAKLAIGRLNFRKAGRSFGALMFLPWSDDLGVAMSLSMMCSSASFSSRSIKDASVRNDTSVRRDSSCSSGGSSSFCGDRWIT